MESMESNEQQSWRDLINELDSMSNEVLMMEKEWQHNKLVLSVTSVNIVRKLDSEDIRLSVNSIREKNNIIQNDNK